MEMKYIVYLTINLCNGKFYIGVHRTNPEIFDGYIGNRIYRQSQATENYPFHKAVRKYGYENFKRTTLVEFPDTEQGYNDAYELESILVNEKLLKSKQCYNVALGGKGSPLESDYKTIYMYDLKGNFLRSFKGAREASAYLKTDNEYSAMKAIRNNCLETSDSAFGFYWTYNKEFNYHKNERLRSVAQYTISGKFLRTFDSISEAERELQCTSIKQAIAKKYAAANYQWRYYEGNDTDIPPLMSYRNKNKIIPIKMFDKNTKELIEEFNCVNDCVEKYPNLDKSQINRVLTKAIKSHKGYYFEYKDEDIVLSILK